MAPSAVIPQRLDLSNTVKANPKALNTGSSASVKPLGTKRKIICFSGTTLPTTSRTPFAEKSYTDKGQQTSTAQSSCKTQVMSSSIATAAAPSAEKCSTTKSKAASALSRKSRRRCGAAWTCVLRQQKSAPGNWADLSRFPLTMASRSWEPL